MTQVEWAYIAGIVDGEGTIHISNQLALRVQVVNTNKELIEWIASETEGRLYDTEHHKRRGKNKVLYCVEYSGLKAQNFLKPLLLYLRLKKVQAELAMLYPVSSPSQNRPLDVGIIRQRQFLREQISKANHPIQELTMGV